MHSLVSATSPSASEACPGSSRSVSPAPPYLSPAISGGGSSRTKSAAAKQSRETRRSSDAVLTSYEPRASPRGAKPPLGGGDEGKGHSAKKKKKK